MWNFNVFIATWKGHTPFSTHHKTKGREYSRVLLILDNGGWTKYNFQHLFEEYGRESVLDRTLKLFYASAAPQAQWNS